MPSQAPAPAVEPAGAWWPGLFTPANAATGSAGSAPQPVATTTTTPASGGAPGKEETAVAGSLFGRIGVMILGVVFVAAGLAMFRAPTIIPGGSVGAKVAGAVRS